MSTDRGLRGPSNRRRSATRAVRCTIAALSVGLAATACIPKNPGPSGLYLGVQSSITPTITPENNGIVWGAAPVIDPNYGKTLYRGTKFETSDPRPAATAQGNQPLRVWVAKPNNTVKKRPAILWFHGGGFAMGVDATDDLARAEGAEYAKRGYVSLSFEYRIDTTLFGDTVPALGRPPALCQWVQDNIDPTDAAWVTKYDKCVENIDAAREDALAAVRWVRAHAAEYDIDPNKIAIGGFSAGAVIASLVGYAPEEVGSTTYFAGDTRSVEASRVRAAFGASGCFVTEDFLPPSQMGAGDAALALIASKNDPITPYTCVTDTVTAARKAGLVAELTSYCNSSAHSKAIYNPNKAATDDAWTNFLARELGLYTDMRPATTAPFCT